MLCLLRSPPPQGIIDFMDFYLNLYCSAYFRVKCPVRIIFLIFNLEFYVPPLAGYASIFTRILGDF